MPFYLPSSALLRNSQDDLATHEVGRALMPSCGHMFPHVPSILTCVLRGASKPMEERGGRGLGSKMCATKGQLRMFSFVLCRTCYAMCTQKAPHNVRLHPLADNVAGVLQSPSDLAKAL